MRILFLSAASSVHTVKWVNALAMRGHEVHLIFNKGHEPKNGEIDRQVTLHQLKFQGIVAYYLNAKELKKITQRIKPEIINVHYASGYGTLARIAGIGPVLLSVWGSDVYDFPYESKLKNQILKKNVRYAKRLASTSNCMADKLREVMDDSSLEVTITPFGIDLELFNPERFEKQKDKIVIGNVKALKAKYGILEFIDAVAMLLDMLKEAGEKDIAEKIQVEIYGDGEQKKLILQKIMLNGLEDVVLIKGKIPNIEVPNALSHFAIFCATSMYESESFGVAVVEAMAMKLPVVVTDVAGFKEVVVDGETGVIVNRQKISEIAGALKHLVLDERERERLGENGRKRVEKLYNWKKNVDVMELLYNKLKQESKAVIGGKNERTIIEKD